MGGMYGQQLGGSHGQLSGAQQPAMVSSSLLLQGQAGAPGGALGGRNSTEQLGSQGGQSGAMGGDTTILSSYAFDKVDFDGSGRIDWQEFEAMQKVLAGAQYNHQSARREFERIDRDCSGDIDKREWIEYFNQQLTNVPHHLHEDFIYDCIRAGMQASKNKLQEAQMLMR